MTFTDPSPDEVAIGKYYISDKYISHTGGKKTLIDRVYTIARSVALGNKRRLIQKISNGKSILDYGCGTGEFLREMQENNWQVDGVEPSDIANAKAQENTKGKICKNLSELDKRKFDVITLWHVLEHLHDLNGSIKNLHDLLNDSGTIFIAVPNLQSYDATHYQSFWAGYDVPRHLWHFNKDNMNQLLSKNGLKLINTLPMKMDSFYVSLLSEGYKNPNQSEIINLLKATIRGFRSNLKGRKNMNYSSLIYIAKK